MILDDVYVKDVCKIGQGDGAARLVLWQASRSD
jgi:hypothetical protein